MRLRDQRRRSFFATLVVAALWYLPAAAEEPAARVARLIRNLGNPDYDVRQRATSQLSHLGTDARRQLEEAAQHEDPEIRLRAQRLLEQLKVRELWEPSWTEHRASATNASEILAAIAKQTGNRVLVGDQYGTFHECSISIDTGRVPFWNAIDQLCRLSGNRVRPHYDTRNPGLVVVAGDPGQFPTAYAGPIRSQILSARRVFIEELSYENLDSEVTHTFQLNLQMMWEDRFRLIAYRSGVEVIDAVTDTGFHLSAMQSSGGGWNVSSRGTRQLSMSLRLHPPPASARRLRELSLRWELLAVGDWATLDVTRLDKADNYYASADQLQLQMRGMSMPRPGRYVITAVVVRDAMLPEPRETLFEENYFELLDAEGRPFVRNGQTNHLADGGVKYKLTFTAPEANAQPARLRLQYPRIRSQRALEITFHDVPLPTASPK